MTIAMESSEQQSVRNRFDREVMDAPKDDENWAIGVVERHLGPILSKFDRAKFESVGIEEFMRGIYDELYFVDSSDHLRGKSKSEKQKAGEVLRAAVEHETLMRIDELIKEAVREDSENPLTQDFVDRLADIKPSSEDAGFHLSVAAVKGQMNKLFSDAIDAVSSGASNSKDLALVAMYYGKNADSIPDHYLDTGRKGRPALVRGADYRLHQAQIEHFVAKSSSDEVRAGAISKYFKLATGIDIEQTYEFGSSGVAAKRFFESTTRTTQEAKKIIFKGTAGAAGFGLAVGAVPAAFATDLPNQLRESMVTESAETEVDLISQRVLKSALAPTPSVDTELPTRRASHVEVRLGPEAMQTVEVEAVTLGAPKPPMFVQVGVDGASGVMERSEVEAIPKGGITLEGLSPEEQFAENIKNGRPDSAAGIIAESVEPNQSEISAETQEGLRQLLDSYKFRLFELRKNSIADDDMVLRVNSAIAYLEAGMKNPLVLGKYQEVTESNDIPTYLAEIYANSGSDEVLLRGVGSSIVAELAQEESFSRTYGDYAGSIAELAGMITIELSIERELVRDYPKAMEAAQVAAQERINREREAGARRELERMAELSEQELAVAKDKAESHGNLELLAAQDLAERDGQLWSRASEIMELALKFSTELGMDLKPHHVSGAIGNFYVETYNDLDPATVQNSRGAGPNGPGRGLAQWERGARFDKLVEFAEEIGLPWDTTEAQVRFMLHELSTSEARAYEKLLEAGTVDEAAYMFGKFYERPADLSLSIDDRQKFANQVMGAYQERFDMRESQAKADIAAYERAKVEAEVHEKAANWSMAEMPNGLAIIENLKGKYDNVSGKLNSGELMKIGEAWGEARLHKEAAAGFLAMNAAFKKEFGSDLILTSDYDAYRSLEVQQNSVNGAKREGDLDKLRLLAEPGTSNHGWGMAVDFSTGSSVIGFDSDEYAWLTRHAWKYGFHNPDWALKDGEKPESWHFEFAGIKAKSHDNRKTVEEVLAAQEAARKAEEEARIEAERQAEREAEAERQRRAEEEKAKQQAAAEEERKKEAQRARERTERSETGVTSGGWAYPVKSSNSACGFDCYKNHRGMDIRDTAMGEPFYSVREGVVVHAGVDDQMNSARCAQISADIGRRDNIWKGPNQVVRIQSEVEGELYEIRYSHLGEGTITVSKGDRVGLGKEVGRVGLTGCTTGVHAHIDIRKKTSSGWVHVDPTNLFGRSW